ncbi:cutinase family protein [Rhodococcus sp. NPDC057297]|uniref:cutinase family protein n=1 Tax=Rhodococcus sp. NPDC057297 TaxID=3346090 RepID=UPI00363ECDB8
MSRTSLPRSSKRSYRLIVLAVALITAVEVATPAIGVAQPSGDCSTAVYFVGARGSDEPLNSDDWDSPSNFGGPVRSFYDRVAATVGADRIAVRPVIYPASEVESLLAPRVSPTLQTELHRSMDDGVKAVIKDLQIITERIERTGCGDAQIVLAGYSQGAMVIHRAILQLVNEDTALSRAVFKHLTAAYLIADGHRVPGDRMVTEGSAVSSDGGINPLTQKFPDWLASRIYSICDYLDPVCSINPSTRSMLAVAGFRAVAPAPVFNWVQGVAMKTFGTQPVNPNVLRAHENYGQRTNAGSSATSIASKVRAGVAVADRGRPSRPATPPRNQPGGPSAPPTHEPDGTSCRDLPGTDLDFNVGKGCSADDTSTAILNSFGIDSRNLWERYLREGDWEDAIGHPLFQYGVSAKLDSTAMLRLSQGGTGSVWAYDNMIIDASAAGADSLVWVIGNRSDVHAHADRGSKVSVGAYDGSVVDVAAADQSIASVNASSMDARVRAEDGSTVYVASGDLKLDVRATSHSTIYLQLYGEGPTDSVATIDAKNGGSVTIRGPLNSDGYHVDGWIQGQLTAMADGDGSRVDITASNLTGTLTVFATRGGYAYILDREEGFEVGCIGGVTSVTTSAGSCESEGEITTITYPDGSKAVFHGVNTGHFLSNAQPMVDSVSHNHLTESVSVDVDTPGPVQTAGSASRRIYSETVASQVDQPGSVGAGDSSLRPSLEDSHELPGVTSGPTSDTAPSEDSNDDAKHSTPSVDSETIGSGAHMPSTETPEDGESQTTYAVAEAAEHESQVTDDAGE